MTTRQGCCVTAIYSFICSCVDRPVLAARVVHCNPQPNCLGFSILCGPNFAANVAPEGFVVVELWRERDGVGEIVNSFTTYHQCPSISMPIALLPKAYQISVSECKQYVRSKHGQQVLFSMLCPIAGSFFSHHLNFFFVLSSVIRQILGQVVGPVKSQPKNPHSFKPQFFL